MHACLYMYMYICILYIHFQAFILVSRQYRVSSFVSCHVISDFKIESFIIINIIRGKGFVINVLDSSQKEVVY